MTKFSPKDCANFWKSFNPFLFECLSSRERPEKREEFMDLAVSGKSRGGILTDETPAHEVVDDRVD